MDAYGAGGMWIVLKVLHFQAQNINFIYRIYKHYMVQKTSLLHLAIN